MADQIFIEALTLDARIGVFDHEYETTQRVRIDLEIDLLPLGDESQYDMANIVRYDEIVQNIRDFISAGHVELVEVMAEKIAQIILDYDGVEKVSVRVSKLSAITEADGVGVKIMRSNS